MAVYRNKSADTVLDVATGRECAPDETITVPDEWAENYEDHPIWELVGGPVAPPPAPPVVPAEEA